MSPPSHDRAAAPAAPGSEASKSAAAAAAPTEAAPAEVEAAKGRPRQAKVHLVGGFLGSGKTTAIAGACKLLAERGVSTGVVTNDQGRYLVDTAFFRAASVPTTEVLGGCFCCNLGEYHDAVERLLREKRPPVVFAEAVGSCADIVATIIKPSELAGGATGRIASYTVFVDVRLARIWLSGVALPFGEDISYLFEKQMEEAGILVVNKTDLLPAAAAAEVVEGLGVRFPGKQVRGQSSLSPAGIEGWVAAIEASPSPGRQSSLEIDYLRYGAAEAELAWYDAVLRLRRRAAPVKRSGREAIAAAPAGHLIRELLVELGSALAAEGRHVGHVKVQVLHSDGECKLSLTGADGGRSLPEVRIADGPVRLVLNARVSGNPTGLRNIVRRTLRSVAAGAGWDVSVSGERAFRPSFPHPTERVG